MLLEAMLLGVLGSVAAPSQVELGWESVAGCPTREAIDRELEVLLGRGSPVREARATGHLERDRGGYVLYLQVEVSGRRESRELRANDCTLLSRAGALVMAVTIDALATEAATATAAVSVPAPSEDLWPGLVPQSPIAATMPTITTTPRPPASPGAAEGGSVTTARPRPPRPPRRSAVTAGASGGMSVGMTPGIAGGVEGELGWRLGSLRLIASGFHWFSRSSELQPRAGIRAALSGGTIRGCLAMEAPRIEVPLCVGLELGAMHGGGTGALVQPRKVRVLWAGVSVGAGFAVWITKRFALAARAEAVLAARRPSMFLLIGGEPHLAYTMPPVAARLMTGPLFRLW